MATLAQRIEALEQAQKKHIAHDPQREADVQTACQYFFGNGGSYDMLPPSHFTESECAALEMVIFLDSSV